MEQRGVTVVELVVVLAVAAILFAIVVPGYANVMNHNRVVTATNELVSALQLARSEAIRRNQRVTVCKTSLVPSSPPACDAAAEWHHGWVTFVDGGTKGAIDAGDQVLKVHGGIPLAAVSATNFSAYASYLPGGGSQGPNGLANGKLIICLGGNERSIIVNSTGRIKIAKGDC